MIKELRLENIEIEDGEKNIVAQNIQGRILKVLFVPSEANSGVELRIFTKEGEKVMAVTQEGLYYPRANVSSEKMLDYTFSPAGDDKDYYYFNKELLFNITTSKSNFEGIVIDKLVLIYETKESKMQQMQTVLLSRMLQEIINLKQREFEDGRGQTRLFG